MIAEAVILLNLCEILQAFVWLAKGNCTCMPFAYRKGGAGAGHGMNQITTAHLYIMQERKN